jgi:hypothetical protein
MDIVNVKLLSHPMNWVTVMLMLIIAGAFGSMTLKLFGKNAASSGVYPSVSPGITRQTAAQFNNSTPAPNTYAQAAG